MRELEVLQDGDDDGRIGEEGEDPHGATTRGAEQRQDLVDASEQQGPTDASGVCGASRLRIDGALRAWARDLSAGRFGFGPADVVTAARSLAFGARTP